MLSASLPRSFPPTHLGVRATWETLELALELEEGWSRRLSHPHLECLGLGQVADRGQGMEGRGGEGSQTVQNRDLP